jgi:alpha/beta superfamily hydrolase
VTVENQHITFMADSVTCEGLLAWPGAENGKAPAIVICHPHPLRGGDMFNSVVTGLAEVFTAAGFVTLRFNFRGVGRSTGQYAEGLGEQEDAKAAMAWLMTQPGINPDRLFLAGYSFGARVALAVAPTDCRVGGFVVVAPPVLRGDWPPLESARGPKIFFCGEHDPVAPPAVVMDRIKALPEPKRLAVVPNADHFFVGQEYSLAQHAAKLLQELS